MVPIYPQNRFKKMRRIDVNELEVEVLVSLSIGLGAQVVYQNTRLTTPQWDTLPRWVPFRTTYSLSLKVAIEEGQLHEFVLTPSSKAFPSAWERSYPESSVE